ncbi:MAG: hypothetical protein KGP28_07575 [Bdellovibrionales bacterium]|nr:hypothetical protein [Bdellovibrionales bacterium]
MTKIVRAMLVFLVSGCASPIMYKKAEPVNVNGEGFRTGFSDEKITTNRFHVKFQGNGYNTTTDVYKKCLRRAAEITVENGFRWFQLENNVQGAGGYGALNPWPNHEADVIFLMKKSYQSFDAEDVLKSNP